MTDADDGTEDGGSDGPARVRLTGRLECQNRDDARLVARLLPDHVSRTRAEPGCLCFMVTPLADGLSWAVDEEFADSNAFEAHQQRAARSEWGRATAHIPRSYRITGVAGGPPSVPDPRPGLPDASATQAPA